jgi:tRNA threonylcarbamoyladenosine modification (KEOPS) complex  Pcc1 subunit
MSMNYSIELKATFPTRKDALAFFKSINPELRTKIDKFLITVSQNDNVLVFKMTASDKSSIRAALSAIRKPLKMFNEISE